MLRAFTYPFLLLATIPVYGWSPGSYPESPTPMYSVKLGVDRTNRNDVAAFWHAIYQASEGYENRIGWTGNYSDNPGATSRAFIRDVERRINYFRAMAGIPANVRVNTDSSVLIRPLDAFRPAADTPKASAAQRSAIMLVRNYSPTTHQNPAITHNPLPSLAGWSTAAWNANANSNLSFGLFGPGAVTGYMLEEHATGTATSNWNDSVGHRRWLLYPPATDFASGDQPGDSPLRPPTNVLYVTQNPVERSASPPHKFVAYPSAGFFPCPINSRYWSLSRAGADFSAARVTVTDSAGKSVPVSDVKHGGNYGDPALTWQVAPAAASKRIYADTTFRVVVSGIRGDGIPPSYNYQVTLMNPNRITSNQSIKGPSNPIANQSTFYSFTAPSKAEALQVTAFLRKRASWVETAEASRPTIIDHTSGDYPLINRNQLFGLGPISGSGAFHLTFPMLYDLIERGVPEQSFEINRLTLAGTGAKLRFYYRRGFMTTATTLAIESSANEGVTWTKLGTITGKSNSSVDAQPSLAEFSLPKSARPIRFRFRYYATPGAPVFTHEAAPTSPTGIFIDDIRVTHCKWLAPGKTTTLESSASGFTFNQTSAGNTLVKGAVWHLGLRTKLGGRWFHYGPLKKVRIAAP